MKKTSAITLQTALRVVSASLQGDCSIVIDTAVAELDRLGYIESAVADLLRALRNADDEDDIRSIMVLLRSAIEAGPNANLLT